MSGANPAAVQRIMRHTDPRITTDVYGHLLPEDLPQGDRPPDVWLQAGPGSHGVASRNRGCEFSSHNLLTRPGESRLGADRTLGKPKRLCGFESVGAAGLEPTT